MKPYASYKPSGVAWLGDVPEHWHVEKLKFFANFVGGGTPSKDEPCYWGGDFPWVSPKDMKRPLIGATEDYITSAGLGNSPCVLIPPYSVLTVVRSGILQHTIPVAINTVPVTLNQDMRALIPNERVNSRYLAYQIEGCQKELREEWVKQGATVESIEHQRMVDSRLAVPPPDEQQAIADYLDTETARIDTLVQEKEELIGLLREWRQSVIAEVVTKGLNKTVAMKPSGVPWLGEVPSHWSVAKLKFFVGFAGGGTPSKDNPAYWEGNIPWVSPKDMKRPRISETEDYITEVGQMNSPCTLIPPLSVLTVVRSGILQHSIPVALNMVPVTLNQDMKALLPSERANSRFLAYEISGCQKELREAWVKQGATVESIEHQRMADSELALPPLQEQQAIADYLDDETAKIDALITHTQEEIALLKELRAATIADAVLGRVDVRSLTQKQ